MRINKFFILLLFVLPSTGFCHTREDVIKDAETYSQYLWKPELRNLLDEKHCDVTASTTTYPDKKVPGGNAIDDRREFYNIKTESCENDSLHWPFEVCSTCTYHGEAYAFGVYHTTTMFKSKIEAVSEKWIAGKRDIDSLPIGSDYKGFAGIDCSGFVSKIWALNIDTNTYGLTNFSIKISSDKAKAGDMIDKVGTHVILFDHWIEPNKAAVLHSAGWSISSPAHVRRVIVDVATFTQEDGLYYLYWATGNKVEKPYDDYHLYEFYSAFPQITWLKNGNITDTVKVQIKSGTKISTGTIRFVIDEDLATATTIYADKLTVSAKTLDGKTVEAEYNMATDLRVSTGPHTVKAYATNIINLEDGEPVDFNLTRVAPVITFWESWKGEMKTGVVYGEIAQSTPPWLHSTSGGFFLTAVPGLKSFKIYADDTFSDVLYNEVFSDTTSAKADANALLPVPDGFNRVAVAEDSLGRKTTMYFNLDRTGITVDVNSAVVNIIGDDISVDVTGVVVDTMSGIGIALATITASEPVDVYYTGPTNLQGPASYQFSLTGLTESHKLAAMDRASWLGSYNLGINISTEDFTVDNNIFVSTFSPYISLGLGGGGFGGIAKHATLTIGGYNRNIDIEAIDPPTGMKVELYIKSSTEIITDPGFPTLLNYSSSLSQKLLEAYSGGTVSGNFNILLDRNSHSELKSYGNTNSGRARYCTQRVDGVCQNWWEGTYGPDTFFYNAAGSVNVKFLNLGGGSEWYKDYGGLPYAAAVMDGVNILVENPGWPFNIDINKKNINLLNLPTGFKPVYDYVYDITVNGSYAGPVTLMMNYAAEGFTDLQKDNMTIYGGDGSYNFTALATERFAGWAQSVIQHFSPYALVTPVDDITPPSSALVSDDYSYSSSGNVYVSTGAYFRVTAEDYAVKGDITGVATRYYLIDSSPDAVCLATPYDPQAGKGTCANPVYDDIFTLSEGAHTVYYTAEDNFQNKALWQWLDFLADGTPPVTAIEVRGERIGDGGATNISNEDFVSLVSEDPVSNNVASGVEKIYYTTNTLDYAEFPGDGIDLSQFGVYDLPFKLDYGTYTVSYFASDNVGNTEGVKSINIEVVSPLPSPTIISPLNNSIIFSSSPLFLGNTGSGYTVRFFEGQELKAETRADSEGIFSAKVPLSFGPHSIKIDAVNESGIETGAISRNITTKNKTPFIFAPPILRPYNPDTPWLTIRATATAVSDFDKDGNQDIVMFGDSSYVFLKGDGTGAFPSFTKVDTKFGLLFYVLPADINKDGNMDIVGVRLLANGAIMIMTGNGNGTFNPVQWIPTGYFFADNIGLGDFNNDGFPDIAVKTGDPVAYGHIVIYVGLGDGTFGLVSKTPITFPGAAGDMSVADFNNDNKLDLIIGEMIFYGDGSGGISASRHLLNGGTYRNIVSDFNGDTLPDILFVKNVEPCVMTSFINLGNDKFHQVSNGNMILPTLTASPGDLNADGLTDLVLSDFMGRFHLSASVGDGLFEGITTLNSGDPSASVESIQIADLNKDGYQDMVAALVTPTTRNDIVLFFNKLAGEDTVITGATRSFILLNTPKSEAI